MLRQATWSLENSFTKFLSRRLQPRRPGYFPGQVSWLTETFTFTEPSQPPRRAGPFQPATGSVVPASCLRPGGFWSRRGRCSPLTVAGATPDFHRLPSLGCRSPSRASAPGKLLCYSMKISDGSPIEGLTRPASPLVCAGLPRASGLGANAITRMVYLFPSRPSLVERACSQAASFGTTTVRLDSPYWLVGST